jgi:ferredoxin
MGAITLSAPEGGRLLDLIDSAALRIELSCRSADCGTCVIEVLEGENELIPPDGDEVVRLGLGGGPGASRSRLACQVRMRPGLGLVHLRVSETGPASRATHRA